MSLKTERDHELRIKKRNPLHGLFKLLGVMGKEVVMTDDLQGDEELIKCLREAKAEWLNTSANFEQADNREIIDYYTYKLKACEIRYEYYLKKAKERGLLL
jgi:hypothetical protein